MIALTIAMLIFVGFTTCLGLWLIWTTQDDDE